MNFIFCGITLSQTEVLNKFNSLWKVNSPVKRGDIAKIISEYSPGIIIIIDGVFHQSESVSIKEIRSALQLGWKVYGTSSMGALRAIECKTLGMIGFGKVYRYMSLFKIADDDEVAQSISPIDHQPLSIAMVDIRFFLKNLLLKKLIHYEDYVGLIKHFKSIYYPHRNLNIIREYLTQGKKISSIQEVESMLQNFQSQKKLDAIALLNKIIRQK